MIAEKMKEMVANSSAIRAMFEEGNRLAQIYGPENVYDFSLGNPNIPAPEALTKAMKDVLLEEDPVELHGYTNSNAGYADVREAVARNLNERYGTSFEGKNITMTVGAAGGLNVILKTLINPGDEVIVYGGARVPFLTKYYDNTIIGYSFSKSLSLPGERIGYLVIPDEVTDSEEVISAANVATRILGFVNAPTLQQKAVARCLNEKADLAFYDRNRETLYEGLKKAGFSCIKPEGAFYLFVKSPVEDEKEFCTRAKKYNLLLVPGSSFGCPGFVRLAYCVAYDTIVRSLPKFEKLAAEYREME